MVRNPATTSVAQSDASTATQDLKAQQEMSEWALGVLIVSCLGFAVTVSGVFFVWRTLLETRQVGRDQSRAYLHADKLLFFWGGKGEDQPRFKVFVANSGSTPARWYQVRTSQMAVSHDSDAFPRSWAETGVSGIPFSNRWNAVPAQEEGLSPTFFLDETESAEALKARDSNFAPSNHSFVVFGEIR